MKAWAVLIETGELRPYGNGNQWQYPIFPTRKEAVSWRNESRYNRRGSIVRVLVYVERSGLRRIGRKLTLKQIKHFGSVKAKRA